MEIYLEILVFGWTTINIIMDSLENTLLSMKLETIKLWFICWPTRSWSSHSIDLSIHG